MKEAQQHSATHPETGASLLIDVVVTYFFVQKPLGRMADSDVDCYGYTEVEFDIVRIFDEDDNVECPLNCLTDEFVDGELTEKVVEEMQKR